MLDDFLIELLKEQQESSSSFVQKEDSQEIYVNSESSIPEQPISPVFDT